MARVLISAILCAGAGFLLGWFPVVSTDLGHHVATGRWILEHGLVPRADVLSWTAADHTWYLYQWLADVLLAQVEAVGALSGLICLRASLVAALALAIYFSAYVRSRSHLAAVLATLVAVSLLQPRLLLRPMLFGYVALALLDGLLATLEQRERWRVRLAAHLVLLVWASVHPLFLFGLLRWGVHALAQIARGRRAGPEIVSAGVALVTSVAVVEVVVPHGFEAVLSVLDAGGDSYFAAMIVELQPFLSVYPLEALHLVLVGFWLASLVRGDGTWRTRAVRQSLVLALLAGALLKARLFAPFVILAAPFAAVGARAALAGLARTRLARSAPALAGVLAAVAVAGTLLGSSVGFGVGRAENLYPRAAATHLAADPPARMYHDLLFGGFVLWELGQRSFIDGRLELFGSSFARDPYRRVYSAGTDWHRHLAWLGADAILLSPGRAGRLHQALARRPEWHISYADEVAVVYRRARN